jgi:hypothetical protein
MYAEHIAQRASGEQGLMGPGVLLWRSQPPRAPLLCKVRSPNAGCRNVMSRVRVDEVVGREAVLDVSGRSLRIVVQELQVRRPTGSRRTPSLVLVGAPTGVSGSFQFEVDEILWVARPVPERIDLLLAHLGAGDRVRVRELADRCPWCAAAISSSFCGSCGTRVRLLSGRRCMPHRDHKPDEGGSPFCPDCGLTLRAESLPPAARRRFRRLL